MTSFAIIRSQVEERIPGALTVYERSVPRTFRTGIAAIDHYGIPQGGLTQICAPPGISSGKTTILISLMAQLTQAEHFCSLVDASDSFDPAGAEAAGVDLSRMLWVRCRPKMPRSKGFTPLEQAFKAADILVQNGGFGLIAVDLANIDERMLRKVPLTTWFRFARVVEKTETALVFLAPYPAAQSCAALTLHSAIETACWSGVKSLPHTMILESIGHQVEISRARDRKGPHSVKPQFLAMPRWA
jgi:recombination protein RecA